MQLLAGLKVVEFTHMVMGPAVGAILVELGAEVVKVEPIGGDATRQLLGSGAGYFSMYNRNKKSLCLDLKSEDGLAIARRLTSAADIVVENFRAGTMDKLGLGYDALAAENPRLIYCSEKGFLSGPYEHRTALDEVAQMMGGLAYMTGPPGRPLRAGSSVIDVTGGMFGVIGILAALEERHRTGRGRLISSSLFETTVYLVGQHMAQKAVTGQAAKPMPVRISAWAIYDVFETADGEQVFVGVVSDSLWEKFCRAFELHELGANPEYRDELAARARSRGFAAAGARAVQALHQDRAGREARAHGPALRADRQARGHVRRSAPAGERRPRPRSRWSTARAPGCRCCRSRWTESARRRAASCRSPANTATNCSVASACLPRTSNGCARPGSSSRPDRPCPGRVPPPRSGSRSRA